ncbi:uncharacterized protein JN550_000881 [Neoarthrinium moseri]|uniref:uncharacterized protein n=1 Tax=Neoarthrinium moseri TaxID=1658444 RepID=UPI001FDCBD98|nr:uncharacterized protein JN550_000881 [Neoarthrinium moseri]KAI1876809.1 hypothetical protein JN550_000881 [Neoarthrinium moseri]
MAGQEGYFHLFSSLPAEIRLEIWQYTCCQPRVVEVYYDAAQDICTTNTPQPAALHVCTESRREASRVYKPLFGTISYAANIYFHPDLDTLYIPRPTYMGYDDNARDFTQLVTGAADISNLALDHVNPAIRKPWETYNKYALMQSFPRVSEVYLVLDSNSENGVENDRAKHGFLRLAEPARDSSEVCKLLQDIKMSFAYEVGADFGFDDKTEGAPQQPALVLKSRVETDYLRLL